MHRPIIPAVFIALMLGFLAVGTVSAHASLISSTPKDGATLGAVPQTITLVFNEELSDKSGFTVADASGAPVGEGTLDLNDLERKTLSGTLPGTTANGAYTVNWVAISSDDDNREEGTVSFTLAVTQATAPPTVAPTVAPTATPTVVLTAAPTVAPQPTDVPRPTMMMINSPTSPDGPAQLNDDGATAGRMIALIVGLITIIGITVAVVLTRRRGGQR